MLFKKELKKGEWSDWRRQRLDILYLSVTFFLFVLQNEICIIRIKKQNDVFEMSILFDSITKQRDEI